MLVVEVIVPIVVAILCRQDQQNGVFVFAALVVVVSKMANQLRSTSNLFPAITKHGCNYWTEEHLKTYLSTSLKNDNEADDDDSQFFRDL